VIHTGLYSLRTTATTAITPLMGVKFLGIQRASDGLGGYVIPTERTEAREARRVFQMFTTQYKPFINTLQVSRSSSSS